MIEFVLKPCSLNMIYSIACTTTQGNFNLESVLVIDLNSISTHFECGIRKMVQFENKETLDIRLNLHNLQHNCFKNKKFAYALNQDKSVHKQHKICEFVNVISRYD